MICSNLTKIEDGIGEKIGIFLFFESTFVAGIIMALIKGWKLALVCLVSLPLSTISMGLITWVITIQLQHVIILQLIHSYLSCPRNFRNKKWSRMLQLVQWLKKC